MVKAVSMIYVKSDIMFGQTNGLHFSIQNDT